MGSRHKVLNLWNPPQLVLVSRATRFRTVLVVLAKFFIEPGDATIRVCLRTLFSRLKRFTHLVRCVGDLFFNDCFSRRSFLPYSFACPFPGNFELFLSGVPCRPYWKFVLISSRRMAKFACIASLRYYRVAHFSSATMQCFVYEFAHAQPTR